MKDWKDIIQLYERDNSYLAEAAQLIQRLVHYEIPAANRQIAKGENGYEDAVQKQGEYAKQAVAADAAYKAELARMGIKGENFRKEIIELTKEIPGFMEKILSAVKELKPAIDYYDGYNAHITYVPLFPNVIIIVIISAKTRKTLMFSPSLKIC